MSKFIILAAVLAVAVFCHDGAPPTTEQIKTELINSGISADAAAGIIAIGDKYQDKFNEIKGDKEAGKKLFDEIKAETDAYIKTQSTADQTAYDAFVATKKAFVEAHKSAESA